MKEDCYKLMYGFFWLRGRCLEAAEMMSCSTRFSFSHGFLFFCFFGKVDRNPHQGIVAFFPGCVVWLGGLRCWRDEIMTM